MYGKDTGMIFIYSLSTRSNIGVFVSDFNVFALLWIDRYNLSWNGIMWKHIKHSEIRQQVRMWARAIQLIEYLITIMIMDATIT